MKEPSGLGTASNPILAPLGRSRNYLARAWERLERLPPAVAPVAVTLVGGLAVAIVVSALMTGGEPPASGDGSQAASSPVPAATPSDSSPEDRSADVPDVATAQPIAPAPAAPQEPDISRLTDSSLLNGAGFGNGQPAARDDTTTDGGVTASIPPAMPGAGSFAPAVPVAETVDEVAELEEIQRREVEADVGAPSPEQTAALPPSAAVRVKAAATKWVNMRAEPSDDAEILMVVPALAEIEAEAACDWCSVAYDGREGFIYKTFISYEESAPVE